VVDSVKRETERERFPVFKKDMEPVRNIQIYCKIPQKFRK